MSKLCEETMRRAYYNISFSPERRGAQVFEYYTELLKEDLEELGENTGNYEAKFIDKIMAYYYSLSNVASSMITGPANFPFNSNQKKSQWADNKLDHFCHWRTKYFKAVNRVRTLSPEAELDKLPKEIDELEARKDKFKRIKKCKDANERGQLVFLFFPYLSDWDKEYLIDKGITYHIPSLTRKILARKKKIEVMKVRIERKAEFKPLVFDGGSITLENDRVIVSHDEKPSAEIIKEIKSHGFKYSPKTTSWVRKHTGNAIYSAETLYKNVLNKAVA